MKVYQWLIGSLLFEGFLFLLVVPRLIWAKTVEVGDLQIELSDPLFTAETLWLPGKTERREIVVTNRNRQEPHWFGMKGKVRKNSLLLAELVFQIESEGKVLWGPGSLRDFLNQGEVELAKIDPGRTKIFSVLITLPKNTGDDFQGEKGVVDFTLGFLAREEGKVAGKEGPPGELGGGEAMTGEVAGRKYLGQGGWVGVILLVGGATVLFWWRWRQKLPKGGGVG